MADDAEVFELNDDEARNLLRLLAIYVRGTTTAQHDPTILRIREVAGDLVDSLPPRLSRLPDVVRDHRACNGDALTVGREGR